jgi:hypothetical protein
MTLCWQTTTPDLVWGNSGVTSTRAPILDNSGKPLPASLAQPAGTSTAPYTGTFTPFNANKHYQLNEDVAFFKGGWWGTHNIKVGYQLNHLVNVISQNGNVPQAILNLGPAGHATSTSYGVSQCATLTAEWGPASTATWWYRISRPC